MRALNFTACSLYQINIGLSLPLSVAGPNPEITYSTRYEVHAKREGMIIQDRSSKTHLCTSRFQRFVAHVDQNNEHFLRYQSMRFSALRFFRHQSLAGWAIYGLEEKFIFVTFAVHV
jgi:hypothetical protein